MTNSPYCQILYDESTNSLKYVSSSGIFLLPNLVGPAGPAGLDGTNVT